MFTGIIEEIGQVKSISRSRNSVKLTIACEIVISDLKLGDSVSVNGICLTVTDFGSGYFSVDVMPETMRKTNLEKLEAQSKVNLERALRLSDRMGGHIVSGHIDGTGRIVDRTREENAIWLTIEAPQYILRYVVEKGSVALDGTSLTVASVNDCGFKISLIPFTSGHTVLGLKAIGDEINIECDMLGKYVDKLLGAGKEEVNYSKTNMTVDFLKSNGFA